MDGPTPRSGRDYWLLVLAAAHVGHTLWFGWAYPEVVYDPDLLQYFVYWTNLATGSTSAPDATPYFTVPKPLLVLLLGPLNDPQAAFLVSALAAGVFGALVYLIAGRLFGRTAGILCSAAVLLDVDRASLTARSSADFYVALFLFASIHLSLVRRHRLSGLAIALAALVKPVALPCAVHLLAVEGEDRRRAWTGAAIAFVALPLTLLANQWLLGSALGMQSVLNTFAAMSDGAQMATGDLLRFVLWVNLSKTIFAATAPFGVLGLILWIGADKRHLTHPFLLAPLALLAGYVALSVTTPFVAFFRFFWPVQVWFTCFIVVGMLETCRRLAPESRALRLGATAALLFFFWDEQTSREMTYRTRFAAPMQRAMHFVTTTDGLFASARTSGQTILAPLPLVPYLTWTIDDVRRRPELVRMAEMAAPPGAAPPDWVIYVPQFLLRAEARSAVETLLSSGMYSPVFAAPDGVGAVYLRRDHRLASAR